MTTTTEAAALLAPDYIPDDIEWAWFWSYNIAAVMMLGLCIVHSVKVYQDFHTPERKSLNHRKNKPHITEQYKFIQYLTLAVLLCHLCDSFLFGLEMASMEEHWSHDTCRNINNVGGWFLLLGKGAMYMLFMYRLDHVYGSSVYGYNRKVLVGIGWANVAFGVLCEAFTTYMSVHHWVYFQDVDEFPNPCGPINDSMLVGFFAVTMQVWDAIMNVLSLALFMYPLWKTMKGVSTENTAAKKKMTSAMVYIALKYTILTFVAFITTLFFWLLVHVAPNEYFLVAFDVVINCVCIMLMTAYYPDKLYYERMCFCFLVCCRSTLHHKTKSEADMRNTSKAIEIEAKSATSNETTTNQTVEPTIDQTMDETITRDIQSRTHNGTITEDHTRQIRQVSVQSHSEMH